MLQRAERKDRAKGKGKLAQISKLKGKGKEEGN